MTEGVSVFVCGRDINAKPCKCGRRSHHECAHALTGKLAGKFCCAPLCESCAFEIHGEMYCRVHAGMRGVKS